MVKCNIAQDQTVTYKVNSTVILMIETLTPKIGTFTISGSVSKSSEDTLVLPKDFGTRSCDSDHFHIKTVGKMIETNESILRTDVIESWINKQRRITARLTDETITMAERQRN